ncbi:hypothetical protein BRE01_31150 [Brevibacillus reuszeri]|uniref:Uncharacterized protein n=1 Tax=Brevibacillus reuszeri TaxID=54915 RepID=A0A0K9YYG8_9BACL|nr:hypothetical protein [Brevibacillus reuszeri]KNB73749.1 hypothetical protein ADS79_07370 [Brevibacillus reuszeri]MED1858437.1 hypothetical protein [Brevibacillus reuszeri]GED69413.1 hypothetical protein BRE01_31150 [Brevibacillus reuszeri]
MANATGKGSRKSAKTEKSELTQGLENKSGAPQSEDFIEVHVKSGKQKWYQLAWCYEKAN